MALRDSWESEARNCIRFATTPDHDQSFWRFGLRQLLDMLPSPGRLTIDVGCGEGRLPRILRQLGQTVVGVDRSATLIARAGELGPPQYVAGDAARLPLASGCADLVVAYMSLHDFDDLAPAVAEIGRILAPGGWLCFAILHPLNTAGAFTERTADAPFVIEGSYLEPSRTEYVSDRGGIRMTFHSRHRPLASYFDAIAAAGMVQGSLAGRDETTRPPASE